MCPSHLLLSYYRDDKITLIMQKHTGRFKKHSKKQLNAF